MSSPNASATTEVRSSHEREAFSSRTVFILAAMGSAIGLGNIWRFPYIAYDNGGGAFMIPYLVALLSAGLPLLMLDYAVGHRFRASAPLAFRRLHPKAEVLGWWQLAICCVIAVYYAAILAWAGSYTIFSFTKAWGDDPEGFLMGQYLQVAETVAPSFDFVPQVLIGMILVWGVLIVVMSLGVQKGIGRFNVIFLPLLIVMFVVMVVISLTLDGAGTGLDALFTPDWSALSNPSVWMAAYGQIFFSLSVGFGIMVTYASYLKPKTDLTSSALVVGFANSSFEILAGIGVFAALGFMASASGVAVGDVATNGIGLAFIAFPTIISEAPAGTLIGVLFFGALTFAGFTSLISIVEVIIAGFRDKLGLTRVPAVLVVTVPLAIVSLALLPTTTGLSLLDVADAFVNNYGIMLVALVAVVLLTSGLTALPVLRDHLNSVSTFKLGRTWMLLVGGLGVVVLGYSLIGQLSVTLSEGYGGYPSWYVGVFGWGMALALPVLSWLMTRIPWSERSRASQQSPAPAILDSVLDRRLLGTSGHSPLQDGPRSPWAQGSEPGARTEIPAENEENVR
ncbi:MULTISPECIES: sodium-dependent transporter [Kocuria]|uniref:sodium-dependent transporter n=1 Tax=Kocuria TaxID=57493 RepID=UPI0010F9CB9B|nr:MULTISPECIES: sodium-dependent transporter [Kocuria]MCM3331106.1 sodium-dependent transporter [Kocuria palustris]MCT1591203.1 sodium-dependent transporter [Kocuria palustris]